MLNLGQRTHGPWADRSADLHLAGSLQLEVVQLALGEVGCREQERQSTLVILALAGALTRPRPRPTLVRINKFHRCTKCLHRSLAG